MDNFYFEKLKYIVLLLKLFIVQIQKVFFFSWIPKLSRQNLNGTKYITSENLLNNSNWGRFGLICPKATESRSKNLKFPPK